MMMMTTMMMMMKDERISLSLSRSSPRAITLYFNERWLIWDNDVVRVDIIVAHDDASTTIDLR